MKHTGLEVRDDGVLTKTIDPNFYLNGGYYDEEEGTYRLANGEPTEMLFPTTVWDVGGGGATGAGFGWIEQPTTFNAPSGRAGDTRRNLYYEVRLNYARTFGCARPDRNSGVQPAGGSHGKQLAGKARRLDRTCHLQL